MRALEEILESGNDVLGEAGSKNILLRPKLMSRLPDDGVDHIQAWHFILWLTLK